MTNIMDENMGNLDIFYNEEKYSLMINIFVSHSRNNNDNDIKSRVFENAF